MLGRHESKPNIQVWVLHRAMILQVSTALIAHSFEVGMVEACFGVPKTSCGAMYTPSKLAWLRPASVSQKPAVVPCLRGCEMMWLPCLAWCWQPLALFLKTHSDHDMQWGWKAPIWNAIVVLLVWVRLMGLPLCPMVCKASWSMSDSISVWA